MQTSEWPTYITGPVQILEEGLGVVRSFRILEKATQRRKATNVIVEELMQVTWSPTRIARWVDEGILDDLIPDPE